MTETYFERLSKAPLDLQLQSLINGGWIARAIGVAAELGIADLLADGPRSSAELARATDAHPRALYRLLRALASVAIFTEVEPATFGLTPMAELLRSDAPKSLRGWARLTDGDVQWATWSQLDYSIRTGQPAFQRVHGMETWEYRARHPSANEIMNAAMTSGSAQLADIIAPAFNFPEVHTLVDVGGGQGIVLAAILRAHPALHGILFDQPHVVDGVGNAFEKAGVADRCRVIGGNFFESVPRGADGYLLKHVIHDWDDEHAIAILANCRRAMQAHAALLLIEEVIPSGDAPSHAKLADLNMLIGPGGQERTEAEYRALYAAAGFSLERVIETGSRLSIIEGTPR